MWRAPTMMSLVFAAAMVNIYLYSDLLHPFSNEIQHAVPLNKTKVSTDEPIIDDNTPTHQHKFFVVPTPEITTSLLSKQNATAYYEYQLNEESAEVWLHRGFERMTLHRTMDPSEAQVFVIGGYFHLARLKEKARTYVTQTLLSRLYNKTMPHVVLCPTWNPETSRKSGIAHFILQLQEEGVNVWSVGFERNPSWQMLNASRIIPIPYVVRPSLPREELIQKATTSHRINNFVFYAGNARKHAIEWAGCNRSMILPLANKQNMDVSLRNSATRLSQDAYNNRMFTSDYCLILCGDTVTSRSLTSSVVYGCLPVRVGSRLRGLCEAPCHKGWGWSITGKEFPHLPFPQYMNWSLYPEVDEADFVNSPLETLEAMFNDMAPLKTRLRREMLQHQLGWIYGWGDPVTSRDFGLASDYVWQSIVATLGLDNIDARGNKNNK